ncbi:hypothetical protein CDD82_755 [Ophiocordyceps australis]|uniref:GPI mannosyltransferase 1 n=1 Tax=Ophiocordyceps australis TaxID=1399860 RepID=A0A2C5XD96_9HYPO|nr:hypothetical protein CDD82_755 [Ophiocordyceps australis]
MRTLPLFLVAALIRILLLVYSAWHDAHSALKYTDIDYLVFTDAARFVAARASPYDRATYRYTPLLAWLLLPLGPAAKLLFVAADLLAGWLLLQCLRRRRASPAYAALWLWNPMVAAISTRGSAEGLLAVLAVALVWAVEARRLHLAALVLGLAVHFKLYPFIYAPAIIWAMDDAHLGKRVAAPPSLLHRLLRFCSPERLQLAGLSLATFMALNALMYSIYAAPFVQHTFLHHLTRLDHRHNFSPYNILLYLSSATPPASSSAAFRVESLAFIPQLLLSCILIPLVLAKRDLATSMLAQTMAFVTFNKVCTSQVRGKINYKPSL